MVIQIQNTPQSQALQSLLDRAVDNKKIFGTSYCLKHNDFTWCGGSGNLESGTPYFIASTTKLFVTAIILRLQSQGKLDIRDSIAKYLDSTTLEGLHVLNGKDFSVEITIQNLLAHNSGLPDYFQYTDRGKESLFKSLMRGQDQALTFEDVLARNKTMKPVFPPNSRGRAFYSDTNFQLLGKIIENITDMSFSQVLEALILEPLALKQSYLYQSPEDTRPADMYFKDSPLRIPQAMAFFGADGGMVSTSSDMCRFIEAFFEGKIFPRDDLPELYVWNKIFFPMQAGIGLHRFKAPWFFDPFGQVPEFLGHSGLSGALAFYCPRKQIYIAGTVNQLAYPSAAFSLMIRLTRLL